MFLVERDTQLTRVTLSPLLNQHFLLTSPRLFYMLLRLVFQVVSAGAPRGVMSSNERASGCSVTT